mgnify:CR=1 FL=1
MGGIATRFLSSVPFAQRFASGGFLSLAAVDELSTIFSPPPFLSPPRVSAGCVFVVRFYYFQLNFVLNGRGGRKRRTPGVRIRDGSCVVTR